MFQRLLDWWRGVEVVETKCFTYGDADALLRQNLGWRLSPLENDNPMIGMVWLERVAST
jgi:hypothetical protein